MAQESQRFEFIWNPNSFSLGSPQKILKNEKITSFFIPSFLDGCCYPKSTVFAVSSSKTDPFCKTCKGSKASWVIGFHFKVTSFLFFSLGFLMNRWWYFRIPIWSHFAGLIADVMYNGNSKWVGLWLRTYIWLFTPLVLSVSGFSGDIVFALEFLKIMWRTDLLGIDRWAVSYFSHIWLFYPDCREPDFYFKG